MSPEVKLLPGRALNKVALKIVIVSLGSLSALSFLVPVWAAAYDDDGIERDYFYTSPKNSSGNADSSASDKNSDKSDSQSVSPRSWLRLNKLKDIGAAERWVMGTYDRNMLYPYTVDVDKAVAIEFAECYGGWCSAELKKLRVLKPGVDIPLEFIPYSSRLAMARSWWRARFTKYLDCSHDTVDARAPLPEKAENWLQKSLLDAEQIIASAQEAPLRELETCMNPVFARQMMYRHQQQAIVYFKINTDEEYQKVFAAKMLRERRF